MNTLATFIGILGVILYISSYQFKNRKTIVDIYTLADVRYVLQYILLGAYTGMAMDFLGLISSFLAGKKNTPFMQKHYKSVIVALDLSMVVVGLLLFQNFFSLFAIVAVIVETSALWCTDEKIIRRLTLIGCPLWLTYNLAFAAFGSAIGNIINFVSLIIAIYRYEKLKK